MDTLNPEQIKAWRRIISMQLEQKMAGTGVYATIMPESEIIAYWQKMKLILEQPAPKVMKKLIIPKIKPPCSHSNSFIGNKGKYCIDCAKYV